MHDISLKKKSTEKREIDEIWDLKEQIKTLSQQISDIHKSLDFLKEKKGHNVVHAPSSILKENYDHQEKNGE